MTSRMDTEVQTRVNLGPNCASQSTKGSFFSCINPGSQSIPPDYWLGALVRWRHPERGVTWPRCLVPIGEQIGIIGKLGHWVLWEACRQGKSWLDAGIAPVRISVNVSALQFRAPVALEADIAAALAQTGMPARMLELELTESVLMDASREHSDLLQRLRKTGVTVAIDDLAPAILRSTTCAGIRAIASRSPRTSSPNWKPRRAMPPSFGQLSVLRAS